MERVSPVPEETTIPSDTSGICLARLSEITAPTPLSFEVEKRSPLTSSIFGILPPELFASISHLDYSPVARWHLGRKGVNPHVQNGSGWEGHLYHMDPQEAVEFIAYYHRISLDSIVRRYPFDYRLKSNLTAFVEQEKHPIVVPHLFEELDITFREFKARAQAQRSQNRKAMEYKEAIYMTADRFSHAFVPTFVRAKDHNSALILVYPQFEDTLQAIRAVFSGQFTIATDDNVLESLSRIDATGYAFAREIGRIGDTTLRFLLRQKNDSIQESLHASRLAYW